MQMVLDDVKALTRTRRINSDKATRSIAGISDDVVIRLKVIAANNNVSIGQLAELAIVKFCDAIDQEVNDNE
jgi:hypothetical protein